MADNEYIYLYRRAETELEQAHRATHVKAAAAHHLLAETYLQRAAALASGSTAKREFP